MDEVIPAIFGALLRVCLRTTQERLSLIDQRTDQTGYLTPMKEITAEQAANELSSLLDRYEWFHSCEKENERVLVVFVFPSKCDKKAWSVIPDILYQFQIKVWDEQYLRCAEKYGLNKPPKRKLSPDASVFDVMED